MRKFLFFILLLALTSCGRAEGDDTVQVTLALRNMASSEIFVETNFPMSLSPEAKTNSGIIHFNESLLLFESEMRRVGSYDDFATQYLSEYPNAEIKIYSVEENAKGQLLLSCPLKDYPGETWDNSYNHSHLRLKTDDYPFYINLGAMWDGERLQGRVDL